MLSNIEITELKKTLSDFMNETTDLQPEEIEAAVAEQARRLIAKSADRAVPWADPISPLDFYTIEKALTEPAGTNAEIKALHDWNDEVYLLSKGLNVSPGKLKSWPLYARKYSELAKALSTSTAGSGEEWIPTGFSNSMVEEVQLQAVVASKFPKITMTSNPFIVPCMTADPVSYLTGESTTDSPSMYRASDPNTNQLTFTAKKITTNVPVSEEQDEDAFAAMMTFLRRSIVRSQASGLDNAIINGDDTTTHRDTGHTVESYDVRRAWNGLRDLTITSGTHDAFYDGSSWSTSAGLGIVRAIREDMEIYGVDPDDLMILCNYNMYNKFRALDEVKTVDKFGSAATVKNGVLEQIEGIEIVLTKHVEEQQNDSGIYDGSTTTDTQFLIVNKNAYMLGDRKKFTIQLVKKPLYGMNYLVAKQRCHWRPIFDATTQPSVGWCYNVTK